MRLRVMFVIEPQLRIRNTIGRRADVGAHASCVGLEGEHVQVAHDLHVFAALVALRYLDLDRRRIGSVAFAGSDPGLFQRGFLLTILDGRDATLHGAHAVEIFIQLVLIVLREFPAKILGAIQYQIEHKTIERIYLRELSRLIGFSKEDD